MTITNYRKIEVDEDEYQGRARPVVDPSPILSAAQSQYAQQQYAQSLKTLVSAYHVDLFPLVYSVLGQRFDVQLSHSEKTVLLRYLYMGFALKGFNSGLLLTWFEKAASSGAICNVLTC